MARLFSVKFENIPNAVKDQNLQQWISNHLTESFKRTGWLYKSPITDRPEKIRGTDDAVAYCRYQGRDKQTARYFAVKFVNVPDEIAHENLKKWIANHIWNGFRRTGWIYDVDGKPERIEGMDQINVFAKFEGVVDDE